VISHLEFLLSDLLCMNGLPHICLLFELVEWLSRLVHAFSNLFRVSNELGKNLFRVSNELAYCVVVNK
jgi:hypothetical protein